MERIQIGLRVNKDLADNLKTDASKAKMSVNQFITQQLEERKNFINLNNKTNLPQISAIYFVIDDVGQILYIGRAKNLKQRWIQHHRFEQLNKMGVVDIVWFECEEESLSEIEELLIDILEPQLNRQKIPFVSLTTQLSSDNKLIRTTAKDKGLLTRLLPEEHTILNAYCNRTGRSKAVVIRAFIRALGKCPKEVEQLLEWREVEESYE